VTKINWIGFDRRILSSISHRLSFGQFQIVSHSQVRKHGKVLFLNLCLLNHYFSTPCSQGDFNTFSINLHHLIFLQCNLNSIQFNPIYMKYHSTFSLKWNLIFTKSFQFFHQLMSWWSLVVHNSPERKWIWITLT